MTPMMSQYYGIKEQYKDSMLFYRMGDFYELFNDDAATAAPILNIVLTKRGTVNGSETPMCGVPHHAMLGYAQKLLESGYKIAICEQLETPEEAKKRGGHKAVVKRDVVRILTPGTIIEENLLDAYSSNNIASIVFNKTECRVTIGLLDASTAKVNIISVDEQYLVEELKKISPTEILVSDNFYHSHKDYIKEFDKKITIRVNALFACQHNKDELLKFYQIKEQAISEFSNDEVISVGILIGYLRYTYKNDTIKLRFPKKVNILRYMSIDNTTMRHLEVINSLNGRSNSLLGVLDNTKTSFGSRMIKSMLQNPLIDHRVINDRLNMVDKYYKNPDLLDAVRNTLSGMPDLERISVRIMNKKGNPRDLRALSSSIKKVIQLHDLGIISGGFMPIIIALMKEIDSAISPEANIIVSEGGYINKNYDPACDRLFALIENSETALNNLRDKYRSITGVQNLKIEYSKQMGFYIEATPQNASKLMNFPEFKHRQTLISATRFLTDELAELEKDILAAKERLIAREIEIFEELVENVSISFEHIFETIDYVAKLDVYSNLAYTAIQNHFIRPIIDDSRNFVVQNARHPVVEKNLKSKHIYFQPNDFDMNDQSNISIITGPNMGGKSTYLRQAACIAIMSHIGSFVPATYAHIGIIDAVFARVGASDDLASGSSTFMVEMLETANIMKNATNRSLVIIDELGRGTSTKDGISIAKACLVYIHDHIKNKCLFATHYTEITELETSLNRAKNYCVSIDESGGNISFLYRILPGIANHSYGIHAAKLAGMPKEIIEMAENV